jgi:hypothetical protein
MTMNMNSDEKLVVNDGGNVGKILYFGIKFTRREFWITVGAAVIIFCLLLSWILLRIFASKSIKIIDKRRGPHPLKTYHLKIKTGPFPKQFYTDPHINGLVIELLDHGKGHIRRIHVPVVRTDKKQVNIPSDEEEQTIIFEYMTYHKFKIIGALQVLVFGFKQKVHIYSISISSKNPKESYTVTIDEEFMMLDPPSGNMTKRKVFKVDKSD